MVRQAILLLAVSCLLSAALAKSKVEELTPQNFKSTVLESDATWAVSFYAPWCGHCKALAPEWEKLASAISPTVRVGSVDADKHKELGGQYDVRGFPTIKVFGKDKKKPEAYQGERTAQAIAKHLLLHVADTVNTALGGGKPKSSSSGGGGGGGGKSAVVNLNESQFKEKVLNGKDEWLVAFVAPWCGHCKRLGPEWEDAAKQLQGEFKLGMVDATVETSLAQRYGVNGYPTIKLFTPEGGGKASPSDYQGGRTASDIVGYANSRLEATQKTTPPPEITSQGVFDEQCNSDRGGICVVAFLPHILDDQSKQRHARLEQLMDARKKAGRTFKMMWVVGGENGDIEDKMGLGFGYPALVALSPAKKRYAVMKGTFSGDAIAAFLENVLKGKESTSDAKPWPLKWRKVPEWDGKDEAPPEEEEVDLD
eukprot:CAMPEP_0114140228 /NCGR_PEP_ID=MMETSP0043_2-20121206/17267_1 /TAXON_ID=464988 /ORGANISM="Hemiselmis andersenii, Strain CCMP644" /LENGTH=423 /DNA_ID=CAMNT_0001234297 /DNA_START=59 /DNA_END=1329 /DNA_ORIENTATION=-